MTDKMFTLRKNAVRAAKALIAKGEAPGSQYRIDPERGGFAIFWQPSEAALTAAEDVAEAGQTDVADTVDELPNPFPDGSLVVALGGKEMPGWHPATVLSRCATDGGAYWRVQFAAMADPTLRQEPDMQIIPPERHAALVAEIEGKDGRPTIPVRGRKAGIPPAPPAMSRAKETQTAVDARNGILPPRPEITSPTNQHYVPRFKKLETLAAGGDWAAVEGFEVKGKNTYAKMLIRYRDQLLTAHRVQQSQTEAAQ